MKLTNKLLNEIYDQYGIEVREEIVATEESQHPTKRKGTTAKKIFRKKVKATAEELAKARGHKTVHKKDLLDAVDKFKGSSVYNPNLSPEMASDMAFRKQLAESGLGIRFKNARGRFVSIFDPSIIIEYQGAGEDNRGRYYQYMLHNDYMYYVVREYMSESEERGYGGIYAIVEQGLYQLDYGHLRPRGI